MFLLNVLASQTRLVAERNEHAEIPSSNNPDAFDKVNPNTYEVRWDKKQRVENRKI